MQLNSCDWWISQLPDEDPVLSHGLDVASNHLACLQFGNRQNFRVLCLFSVLCVQSERTKLQTDESI